MGFRFRKSINLGGGFKTTFSKSGAGFSWGTKGFRVTKKSGGGTRTSVSIPGTGISYSKDSKKGNMGCFTICFVWPLKLCWWLIIGTFWLMWQICYWTVKILFILPIKFIIKLIKKENNSHNHTAETINNKQDS